jgi:hypothetical protein
LTPGLMPRSSAFTIKASRGNSIALLQFSLGSGFLRAARKTFLS